ncbi:MAG: ABC transporter substrate-binding protein, partial [Pseudomonadales bacterium]|nr:ABC transporter substrate-binding protein [Pseudomonadales bacterium]
FGPYSIEAWDSGERLLLTSQESGIPDLGFVFVRDKERLYQLLLSKELDFAWPLPVERMPEVREHLKPIVYRELSYGFIAWNPIDPKALAENGPPDTEAELVQLKTDSPHPIFGDVRVRRALTMAMNRDDYNRRIWAGEATIPATPWRAGLPYFTGDLKPLTYNQEEAGQLLDEAGWVLVDGKRVKDGRPLSFEIVSNAGSGYREQYMLAIQQDLRLIGVNVEIALLEPGLYRKRFQFRDFDAMLGKFLSGTQPDMSPIFRSNSPFNLASWTGVDDLLEEIAAAQPSEVAALLDRIEARFQEELPWTMLFEGMSIAASSDSNLNPRSTYTNPLYEVERWRLE